MENIDEVILFCSSVSQACIPVIQMIQQYQLPVKLVRLDTASFREAAKNGPYFQIKNVPTLIVTYRDGNLRQFVGQPKTLEWLRMVVSPPGPPVDAPGPPAGVPEPPEMQPVPSKRIKGTKVSPPSYSSEEEEFILPKKKKGNKKRGKKSKSSSSSPPLSIKEEGLYGPSKKKKKESTVEFYSSGEDEDEDEMDIEFIDDGNSSAPPTGGLMVGAHAVKSSRMKGSSIAEMAKQMERDRIKTLGYEERSLPVHN